MRPSIQGHADTCAETLRSITHNPKTPPNGFHGTAFPQPHKTPSTSTLRSLQSHCYGFVGGLGRWTGNQRDWLRQ